MVALLMPVALLAASPSDRDSKNPDPGALPGYTAFDDFKHRLEKLAKSPLVDLESLAKTRDGNEILVLKLGGRRKKDDPPLPAVLILGSVEPRHVGPSEILVRMAKKIVRKSSKDKAIGKWLQNHPLYIIPRPSPDAYAAFFEKPILEREKNSRPHDDDRDARTDEDGPEDLDGNGWITQMRVESPYGEYVSLPEEPRLLVPYNSVFPIEDSKGGHSGKQSSSNGIVRYDLYTEGWDNDHDEQWNEDGRGGVAFNRNFTFNYEFFGTAAGPYQVSESETRAIADFAFDHPEIALVVSFAERDNLERAWPCKPASEQGNIKESLLEADQSTMDFFSASYHDVFSGENDSPEKAEAVEFLPGSFGTWSYFHYGRFSLIIPCRSIHKASEEKEEVDKQEASEKEEDSAEGGLDLPGEYEEALRAFAYMDQNKIDGYVPWTPYDHRDFPDRNVEIGGFKPFYRITIPEERLPKQTEKTLAFLRVVTAALPRIGFHEVKRESLGGGIWRITVILDNSGTMPTMPKMGEINRIPQPLQIALDLPEGTKFLTGASRRRVPRLEGRSVSEELVWLVRLAQPTEVKDEDLPLTIKAWGPSVGCIRWPNESLPTEK